MRARRTKLSAGLTRAPFSEVGREAGCCEGAVKRQLFDLQEVAPSTDLHNTSGRSDQWLRPLIPGGSCSSASAVCGVSLALVGGGAS